MSKKIKARNACPHCSKKIANLKNHIKRMHQGQPRRV